MVTMMKNKKMKKGKIRSIAVGIETGNVLNDLGAQVPIGLTIFTLPHRIYWL
jgi:hypothetical protein